MSETQNTKDHGAPLAPGEIRTHTVGDQTFKIMHTGNGAFTQATVRTAGVPTTTVLATLPFEHAALRIYATAIERAEAAAAPEVDYNLPMGANPTLVYGEPTLSGWTSHGYAIRGVPQVGEPRVRARCGGPALCQICGREEVAATALVHGEPVGLDDVPQDRTADGVPEVEQEHRPLDLSLAIAECKRFEEIDRAAVARGESANWWERGGVPEVEQADEPENAAHLLTIIRDNLRRYVPGGGEQYLDRYLAAVAGAVPQRATDADGWGIWQHECGAAQSAKRGDCVCRTCGVKSGDDDWRALYTLGGK